MQIRVRRVYNKFMNNDARGLLMQAEQARERGDFKESLELLADAIVVMVEERKEEKLVDARASQALCYRHLFEKTKTVNYLVLAKHSAMAGVELARQNGGTALLSVALYNLGKVQESGGETEEALKNYTEAVSQSVERPAMLAEMKTRLAVIEFKKGDATAMKRFETALETLKTSEDKDNYAKSVWLSGAYMHMGEVLIGKDNERAKEFLLEARKIIDSDMRLKLRKQQLDKLFLKLS